MWRIAGRVARWIGYELVPRGVRGAVSPERLREFREQLRWVRTQAGDFVVREEFRDDREEHPKRYIDYECEFASEQMARYRPRRVLDVGSYRHWLIGVMAAIEVTTVDVRKRESALANERILTCDATELEVAPESFDMVVTLNTVEHMGLGRYGDHVDLGADRRAVDKMIQAVRRGGHFVFSVPVTRGKPCLAFNSHRIYTLDMVREWVRDLAPRGERFVKKRPARVCDAEQVTAVEGDFDVYCGAYEKR